MTKLIRPTDRRAQILLLYSSIPPCKLLLAFCIHSLSTRLFELVVFEEPHSPVVLLHEAVNARYAPMAPWPVNGGEAGRGGGSASGCRQRGLQTSIKDLRTCCPCCCCCSCCFCWVCRWAGWANGMRQQAAQQCSKCSCRTWDLSCSCCCLAPGERGSGAQP